MAYIWDASNFTTLPSVIYNLPNKEKLFVYAATEKAKKRREDENRHLARLSQRGGKR